MTTAPTGEVLSLSAIAVGMTAADRDDAIAQVGGMLVAEGLVTDGYINAMRAREGISKDRSTGRPSMASSVSPSCRLAFWAFRRTYCKEKCG